jgi:hypothetical protein
VLNCHGVSFLRTLAILLTAKGFIFLSLITLRIIWKWYCMAHGLWEVGLFMKRWQPDLNPYAEALSMVPLWVCLLNMPLEFCSSKSLEAICDMLGDFVHLSKPPGLKLPLPFVASFWDFCHPLATPPNSSMG